MLSVRDLMNLHTGPIMNLHFAKLCAAKVIGQHVDVVNRAIVAIEGVTCETEKSSLNHEMVDSAQVSSIVEINTILRFERVIQKSYKEIEGVYFSLQAARVFFPNPNPDIASAHTYTVWAAERSGGAYFVHRELVKLLPEILNICIKTKSKIRNPEAMVAYLNEEQQNLYLQNIHILN